MMQRVISLFLVVALSSASAWVAPASPTCTRTPSSTQLQAHAASSRADFLKRVVATAGTAAFVGSTSGSQPAWAVVETLPNGVSYEVLKKGNGLKADVGELIAIRFAAYNGPVKMDDIFETPEPYYTRLGSGGLIQGVEQTLPLMSLGDRWKLTIPVGFCTECRLIVLYAFYVLFRNHVFSHDLSNITSNISLCCCRATWPLVKRDVRHRLAKGAFRRMPRLCLMSKL